MAIDSLHSLKQHLQWAIEIEHSTIPPYLTALYSLKAGHNQAVREIILSVFMEEMLHMTLACNIMNAVGGSPLIDSAKLLPRYPIFLPHSDKSFQVPLMKFSKEAVETFIRIEKPEAHDDVPQDDNYTTFGQFFEALEKGMIRLCDELGEANVFTGDPKKQIRPNSTYYGGSGHIIAVENLATALDALNEIREQGEGMQHQAVWDGDTQMFHPDRQEVGHYFRFNEILQGRSYQMGDTPESGPTGEPFVVDWDAVYPMRANIRSTDFPVGSEIRRQMDEFNHMYTDILHLLQRAFNGQPPFLRIATGAMFELSYKAIELMQMPIHETGETAAPSFEYVRRPVQRPKRHIIVRPNGPYVVYGDIPLVRKEQVISEYGEPLTWKRGATIETEDVYALCRCGQSTTKPFCDGSHALVRFDGTETADPTPSASRQVIHEGKGVTVRRDNSLCMEAGFCGTRFKKITDMVSESEDTSIRSLLIAMVERCPSGSYTYSINADEAEIEPSLPQEIAVTTEGELAGALWVTGNIQIERADGKPFETRNRVTLCRCGQSGNKPLCDGKHRELEIKEEKAVL